MKPLLREDIDADAGGFLTALRSPVGITLVAVLLAGCTVGPDFIAPAPPATQSYVSGATPTLTPIPGETTQHLVQNQPIAAEWWRIFGSPALDQLIHEALAGSPTLQAAQATLSQSQHALAEVRGDYFPQVDLAAGAQRQRGPAFALGLLPPNNPQPPLFNLYSIGPLVSYSPDVFGLTSRRIEQQEALAEVEGYQWAVAQLSLTGNTVTGAFILASTHRQIEILQEIIRADEQSLNLTQTQFSVGKVPSNQLLAAQAQLAHDRTLLPTLTQQYSAMANAIAVLAGKLPGTWTAPAFDLADFSLPTELPVSLPSTWVRQRPDIRAAEAQLHASSAAIGVATAQMYPSFPLTASIDTAALSATSLFQQSSLIWSLAGGLTMPIFHGGALTAQKQAAVDAFHATLAIYRQTVLQAFSQVTNTLQALEYDGQRLAAQQLALDSANEALKLQQLSFTAGRSNVLSLLDSERSALQARLDYTQAQTQRYLDSAALFVAMGGGWNDLTLCSPRSKSAVLSTQPPTEETAPTTQGEHQ